MSEMNKADGYITLFVASLNMVAVIYVAATEENIIFLILFTLNLILFGLFGADIIDQQR